jgi:hypothetical protein
MLSKSPKPRHRATTKFPAQIQRDTGSGGRQPSTRRGHATKKLNKDQVEATTFGTKWAENRFREDPDYAAFTPDMVWIEPGVVPNAKKRETLKNLICDVAVKRWRALRDQARRSAPSGRSSMR